MASSSSLVLPRFVTLAGDNQRFLCLRNQQDLHFDGTEFDGEGAVHEVIQQDGDMNVRFRCVGNGRFWWHHASEWTNNQINASANTIPTNAQRDGLFQMTELSFNIIALKAMANDRFCKRFTRLGTNKYRAMDHPGPSEFARLTVAEPVRSRVLERIVYDLSRARITEHRPLPLASVSHTNSTTSLNDVQLAVTYSTTDTSSWSNSVSVGVTIGLRFTAGVPLVASKEVEISASSAYERMWGESVSQSSQVTSTVTVKDVRPGFRVMVTVSGQEAKLDVPFSYTQRDTWINGRIQSDDRTDGIFVGRNSYDIEFHATDQDGNEVPAEVREMSRILKANP